MTSENTEMLIERAISAFVEEAYSQSRSWLSRYRQARMGGAGAPYRTADQDADLLDGHLRELGH